MRRAIGEIVHPISEIEILHLDVNRERASVYSTMNYSNLDLHKHRDYI